MLNLPIAMLKFSLILFLLFQGATAAITSPQTGDTLRGQIEILGQMDVPNFASAELAFTFDANASDPAASWFPIQTYTQPLTNPVIAIWDTTAVTDGDYALRLRILLQDGTTQDVVVKSLKIRNNVPIPTATVTQTEAVFNFQPLNGTPEAPNGPTSTPAIVYPSSTPLPPNPASLTTASITAIFWKSALVVLVLFAVFSFILRLRKNI
ncbi:MAG: hypothetical protein IPP55_11760 [Anaerolineales bacterium]|nr:hypothetical protein [Anaerolineales bacterium]